MVDQADERSDSGADVQVAEATGTGSAAQRKAGATSSLKRVAVVTGAALLALGIGFGVWFGLKSSDGNDDDDDDDTTTTGNAVDDDDDDYGFESYEDGLVKLVPPDESELQPGRVISDENVYINEDGTGNFRTHCKESHVSNDDPLLYPENTGASHEHVFFGFPETDAFTTIATLENATELTTCQGGALNQAAYWAPSLFTANGTRLEVIEPLFYYKSGYHLPADTIKAPPEGLVMITGKEFSVPQDVVSAKYRCESWEAPEPQFDEGDPLDHVPYLPDCQPGDLLEVRIVFPQCWDGVNLTSDDLRSHMAYPIEAEVPNVGTGRCPDSHPVAIPEISYNFAFDVTAATGSSDNWRLSSDWDDSQPNGASLHADWMNGWDPDIMDLIVENCINPGYDCDVGLLGDGTRLTEVG